MIPSWVSAGRPVDGAWLETRLPSLKTTNLPLTRSIGCTMCGPWPTTTVITLALVSFLATAICEAFGDCEFSVAPVELGDDRVGARVARLAGVVDDRLRAGLRVRGWIVVDATTGCGGGRPLVASV